MPIYTYECQKCGHRFEAFSKYTDHWCRQCEHVPCTGSAQRVPSVPAPAIFNCPMPTYQRPKT